MKIDITEKQYFYMADDDKVRLFVLLEDIDLHEKILKIRGKHKLKKRDLVSYFVDHPSSSLFADTLNLVKRSGYLMPDWHQTILEFCFEDKIITVPQNYNFVDTEDFKGIEIKQWKSKTDLKNWVDENEDRLKTIRPKFFVKRGYLNKRDLPKFDNIKVMNDIIRLRNKNKTEKEIYSELDQKYPYNELDYFTKFYKKRRTQILKFLQEQDNFEDLLADFLGKK